MPSMRIALVYDRVNKWGGAERVLLALHELFPEAPIYTSVYSAGTSSVYNPETASWARVFPKVYTSFLQHWRWARMHHEWLAPLMPIAFESFSFDEYDLVISVTSEAAKGIITKPHTRHICYCLTPTRYLWSGYDTYLGDGFKRWITKLMVGYLRKWDKVASQRPDVMVGISETVAGRIKRYYDRESEVVYPPVDIHLGGVMASPSTALGIQPATIRGVSGEYFLLVSRLVSYKRVELAVEAFNELGLPLVVVGIGSEERRLKKMAGKNIHFVGQLTDEELASYYKEAQALIFPQEEDFGIVAVEAQSFGTPVIAFGGGGALETVIPGKTGEFFSPQTTGALMDIVKKFDKKKYDPANTIKNAQKFSKSRFVKELLKIINHYV